MTSFLFQDPRFIFLLWSSVLKVFRNSSPWNTCCLVLSFPTLVMHFNASQLHVMVPSLLIGRSGSCVSRPTWRRPWCSMLLRTPERFWRRFLCRWDLSCSEYKRVYITWRVTVKWHRTAGGREDLLLDLNQFWIGFSICVRSGSEVCYMVKTKKVKMLVYILGLLFNMIMEVDEVM